jgi:arginine decarboxylase
MAISSGALRVDRIERDDSDLQHTLDEAASAKTRRRRKAPPGPSAFNRLFVPKRMFFTKGAGVHRDRLTSFELALRHAGVATLNIVPVSSIFPPHCKVINRKQGERMLAPGQVAFAVMARQDTNEPNRLIAASIGWAKPANPDAYGYLSEHHSYGETKQRAGDYAEDLAATMLATTLGLQFDPDKAWDERKEVYRMSGQIVHTDGCVQTARGNKNGLWTTVVALGVFIL